ncbi:MAG: hypothetical protein JW991_03620 [Candidatus Pacebacteria bacterium]|nr:hypothetical protein [Candidatus Paceibacterota bacterium]
MIGKVHASSVSLGNFVGVGPMYTNINPAEPLSLLEKVISVIIGIMTIGGGIYFLFIFITAAFQWIEAGGDKNKLQKARDKIVQAVIGLVVLVAAYAIISVLGFVLGFSILQPGSLLGDIWGS